MTARGPAARTLELDDDYPAINELYVERGWTDGLPIIPPTEGRVAEFQTDRKLAVNLLSAQYSPLALVLKNFPNTISSKAGWQTSFPLREFFRMISTLPYSLIMPIKLAL